MSALPVTSRKARIGGRADRRAATAMSTVTPRMTTIRAMNGSSSTGALGAPPAGGMPGAAVAAVARLVTNASITQAKGRLITILTAVLTVAEASGPPASRAY